MVARSGVNKNSKNSHMGQGQGGGGGDLGGDDPRPDSSLGKT